MRSPMTRGRGAGFTLIELVVAITIIAILAAVALPRFINVQSQARAAKMQGLYGAIRSAAALAKAACLTDLGGVSTVPTCTATAGSVNMDGVLVEMANQYPRATGAGIVQAAQINTAVDQVTIQVGNPILIQSTGATDPSSCQISYQEATVGTQPVIAITTARC